MDAGVGVSGHIVKKLLASFGNSFGTFCLAGGNGAEGGEKGRVDGASVIQKRSDDVLDSFDGGRREGFGCVDGDTLNFRTILYRKVFVRLMLRADWGGMLELEEGFGDILGHVHRYNELRVVPI